MRIGHKWIVKKSRSICCRQIILMAVVRQGSIRFLSLRLVELPAVIFPLSIPVS